jgi:glutamine synthetase
MKPKAVLAYCREKAIRDFDLRFTDPDGVWRHVTFPIQLLTEHCFEEGFGQSIDIESLRDSAYSQVVLLPSSEANYIDPFTPDPTLVLVCNIQDSVQRQDIELDSRATANLALQFLKSTSIADEVLVGGDIAFGESSEDVHGSHRCGRRDAAYILRCKIGSLGNTAGLPMGRHYCGSNGESHVELLLRNMVESCDDFMMLRYTIEMAAQEIEPQSLWSGRSFSSAWKLTRNSEPVLSGSTHQGLSDLGGYAIEGIRRHSNALTAISVATGGTNSTALVRPIECNSIPDPTQSSERCLFVSGASAMGNVYLMRAATLMAMIDGIQNKMQRSKGGSSTSDTALNRSSAWLAEQLENDLDFLVQGQVFSEAMLSYCQSQLNR